MEPEVFGGRERDAVARRRPDPQAAGLSQQALGLEVARAGAGIGQLREERIAEDLAQWLEEGRIAAEGEEAL